MRAHLALLLTALLAACPRPAGPRDAGTSDAQVDGDAGVDAGAVPPQRCAIPLERYLSNGAVFANSLLVLLFFWEGLLGTTYGMIAIGGPNAYGKIGDWLLANDKIKIIVQGPDRHIGPNPYGGTILDADLVRDGPGQDQFGEVGLFYNLSRTVDPDFMEILSAGGEGAPAIVAASGHDAAHNYLRIKNVFNGT